MDTDILFSSKSTEWETPWHLYNELNREFDFELDPCSTDENCKCERHFTIQDDGLKQDWGKYTVFCNPPYGRGIEKWVKKCAEHKGIAVMLIPARTDTKWFHKYIYHNFNAEIRFLPGRLKFSNCENSAPFPSMIVVFRNR